MRCSSSSAAHRPAGAPWAWALAGALLGIFLTTVLNAPARWFTTALQPLAQGRVVLGDARGTLWRGSAQLTLTGGAGSSDARTLPGRLTWQLRPRWMALEADLQADCCMQQAWHLQLQPHGGGVRLVLSDSLSQWPAQWLVGLGTPWNTLQVEGQLHLATQGLAIEWAAGRLLVAGRAQWEALQTSSRLSPLKPMGNYRLTVQGGATTRLQLETLDGHLQLSGNGQWLGGRLRFDGAASAAPEHLDALSNLLNIIGRRDGARAIIKVG